MHACTVYKFTILTKYQVFNTFKNHAGMFLAKFTKKTSKYFAHDYIKTVSTNFKRTFCDFACSVLLYVV